MLQHAVLRGDRLFCYERPAGAEQFVLTRRSALDPTSGRWCSSTRPRSATTRRRRSTGTTPPATASLVAVGISEGGTEQSVLHVLSGADGSPRAATATASRTPGRARWPGSQTDPGSSTSATRRVTSTTARSTTTASAPTGDDDPVVWDDRPDPQAWPDVLLTPDGRWLVVSVEVGYRRTDVHALDRHADRWSTTSAESTPRRPSRSPPTGDHSSGSPTSTRRVAASCASPSTAKCWIVARTPGTRSSPSATT